MSQPLTDTALLWAEVFALYLLVIAIPSVFTIAIHRSCPSYARHICAAILWVFSFYFLPHVHLPPVRVSPGEQAVPALWNAFPYLELQILPIWFRYCMWIYILAGMFSVILPLGLIQTVKRLFMVRDK